MCLELDVDACQLAYDGEKVYATPAARRALSTGIIFADPTVACPSYELRLVKYSQRGFAVAVPGLDMSRVKSSLKRHLHDEGGEAVASPSRSRRASRSRTPTMTSTASRKQAASTACEAARRSVEHTRLPDYEVVETPITGLGKLVALSTLVWGAEPSTPATHASS